MITEANARSVAPSEPVMRCPMCFSSGVTVRTVTEQILIGVCSACRATFTVRLAVAQTGGRGGQPDPSA